ncbi:MAG: hypothetical protein CME88_04315 [Hirschia sp.]|nr:hypothetical protein [Hirschia sp.]MBF17584.1 hypothetical protein [Hirschia sp.]
MILARRIFGFALWGLSLWLLIQSLRPMMFQLRQTADIGAALQDPVYFLPLGSAVLGVIAGIVVLLAAPAGAMLGMVAATVYAVYGFGAMVMGGGQEMWFPKLVNASLMAVLALGAARLPRKPG